MLFEKIKMEIFMHIESLKLINFRNYDELNVKFNKNINILIGDNAQGKTNILESIYLCSTGRTQKTSKDIELKNFNSDSYYVKVNYKRAEIEQNISLAYSQKQGKVIKINSIPVKKLKNLVGNLVTVIFSPEDLNIIKGSPSDRRRFIDITISQIKKNYFIDLQEYQKVLKQRNALLKLIFKDVNLKDSIEVWNEKLASLGSRIIKERINFINKLNYESDKIQKEISDSKEFVNIIYKTDLILDEKNFENIIEKKILEKLKSNLNYEILRGTTTIGPHRDDLKIKVNDIDIKIYGSQGQQRTAILSVILGKLELIKEEIGEYPILLLDDVSSELDSKRLKNLLNIVNRTQTFITTTELDLINKDDDNYKIYKIENGNIIKK
jgi:DNA replication and repair protein RecF